MQCARHCKPGHGHPAGRLCVLIEALSVGPELARVLVHTASDVQPACHNDKRTADTGVIQVRKLAPPAAMPALSANVVGQEVERSAAPGEVRGPATYDNELVPVGSCTRRCADAYWLDTLVLKDYMPPTVILARGVERQRGKAAMAPALVVQASDHAAGHSARTEERGALQHGQHLLLLEELPHCGMRLQGPLLGVEVKHIAEPRELSPQTKATCTPSPAPSLVRSTVDEAAGLDPFWARHHPHRCRARTGRQ